MRSSPISATVDFEKDGVQHGFLKLPYSRDDSAWGAVMIPIAVIKHGKGPTALLTGANHGDVIGSVGHRVLHYRTAHGSKRVSYSNPAIYGRADEEPVKALPITRTDYSYRFLVDYYPLATARGSVTMRRTCNRGRA